ncbi:MAG TPA: bifunctional riboflavin kinase/FAD synthetase [Candidatus Mediterraneibacter ornithocaccae]|jgi:riboflavin kinase/FMN adenylyltransferase|uniref:bifunctional riboflavin kinase/FAD synthetase n=1 Tax=Mediterraneibacter glycyrrhizinilyticus TaxID=342942 RepID=UPI001FA4CDF9|nr:bifunctional riboflavin kinase/FAD synthetase [Mediterraneibacter glycyrrhizinilyticus]MDN0061338.1 bifunctional riboflavin kinase/FAD synthetase [Mediterraneibacter glycyrrhizinilyticus]HJA19641.1 bifunctional riboflavin kinase/FAD synthetase [Candidatus Mediterraneibacter ornithocaccae]
MKYITGIESYSGQKRSAVTLGKFDGLHLGHQKLIDKIISYASDECESIVCAFDMHRDSLMTGRERREHLEPKVDWLIDQPFTKSLREMEAEEFIDRILYKVLRAAHIVVGTDFSFGYGKRGNAALLQEMADQYGYTVDVIEKERYLGTVISSTYIKDALAQGDVKLAERLLGYPYEMTGIVRHGKQLGRTLGFPTMNIEPEKNKILPRFGVYACRVRIDGKWYDAVGNAGIKPTVTDEQRRLLEVFVYGYDGDAYGKEITAQFCEFERPETKFGSVEELKNNVMRDMRYGERYFAALREKSGE